MSTATTAAPVQIIEQRAYTAAGFPPATEWVVYAGGKLVRVVPSIGMAREIAAGAGL